MPSSPALFAPMVVLDDKTVCHCLDQVIAGKWDKKNFISQCRYYKCQLELKRQILEWMVTSRHIDAKTACDELATCQVPAGRPRGAGRHMEQLLKDCKMSERKTLPTNIAEALTEMVTHQQRVTPLVVCAASHTLSNLCFHVLTVTLSGAWRWQVPHVDLWVGELHSAQ